jgi:hypothetical protein
MGRIPLIAAALVLFISAPSFAQEWIEYVSPTDFFTVNFPAEPKVQNITWETEYSITLPGRVYSYEDGKSRYSVTVVDYADIEKKHAERAKGCKATEAYPDVCNDRGDAELRGALVYASLKFFQRDVKVTDYAYYNADRVEGHRLQLTNADGSRTFAVIHMHENRLYMLEGTVPKGSPPPALFQQSMGFIDKEGKRIRYNTIYSNGYPPPRRDR